jgi:hypothetical protein
METIIKLKQLGLTKKKHPYTSQALKPEKGISKIARMAGQKRPTAYLALDRLEILGLVNQSIRGKKKLWKPVHPKRLQELAEFRASQIANTLPELLAMYKEENEKPSIQMMEGIEGIKNAYRQAFSLINTKHEGSGSQPWWRTRDFRHDERIQSFPSQDQNPHIREIIHGGAESKTWAEKCKMGDKNHQLNIDTKNSVRRINSIETK